MSWINETNKSLLMTAAGDGVVRVWSGVMEAEASLDRDGQGKMQPPELVTGFQAIPVREEDVACEVAQAEVSSSG